MSKGLSALLSQLILWAQNGCKLVMNPTVLERKQGTLQDKFIYLLMTIFCVPFRSWVAVVLWQLQICLAVSQNKGFKQASRCRNCNLIPNIHSRWIIFFWSSLCSLNSMFLSSENKCKWGFSPSRYLNATNFWKRNVDCVMGWYLYFISFHGKQRLYFTTNETMFSTEWWEIFKLFMIVKFTLKKCNDLWVTVILKVHGSSLK